MKKAKKIEKGDVVGVVMGLVVLIPFLPVLLVVVLIMSAYSLVSTLIKHVVLGIENFSKKVSANTRGEVPQLFRRLIKEWLAEDLVEVTYSYVMACGCEEPLRKEDIEKARKEALKTYPMDAHKINTAINGCFPLDRKEMSMKECESLLKSFTDYYDVLDKAHLATNTLHFEVKLKKFKDIDDSMGLIRFCKNETQKKHLTALLGNHSKRRLGICRISYNFIGGQSLAHERSNMVTFPAQAKYATHCEDSTFHISYDGYECGYRALMEGV